MINMELIGIFTNAIGKFNCESTLDLANKIFLDNQCNLIENEKYAGFKTTMVYSRPIKSVVKPFANLEDEEKLKEIILKNAEIYVESLGYEINQRYKLKVINVWMNEMTSNSEHKLHNHYGYSFSGCFYVEIPENSGLINFMQEEHSFLECFDVKNRHGLNSDSFLMNVKKGDMVFWKSTLKHEVPKLEFDGIRKCIAFDIGIE